jgi:hypothetical protein
LTEKQGFLSAAKYPYCGHSVILGRRKNSWQDIEYILRLFYEKLVQPVGDTEALYKRALCRAEGLILLAVDFCAAMADGLQSKHCVRLVPIKKAMSES